MSTSLRRPRWLMWSLRALLLLPLFLPGTPWCSRLRQLGLEHALEQIQHDRQPPSAGGIGRTGQLGSCVWCTGVQLAGAFGIHTWIATKRRNASHYRIDQVIGWNLYRGCLALSVSRVDRSDFSQFNARPELLAEHRGPGISALIDRVEVAVASYPYPGKYRIWPGPNSNSFTAYVAREVPELGLDLPPTAIGKDYWGEGRIFELMPSGSGWQFSLLGLLGVGFAREEGVEVNLLGLSAGIDFKG